LLELLSHFHTAMLITSTAGGFLHARPMVIVKRDGNARIWFMTRVDTTKVDELMFERDVCITMQSEREYVTINGHAEVETDPDRVRAMWCETLEPYFPHGRNDPALALIVVDTERAEYWDESRVSAARYAVEAVRSALNGTPRPSGERSQHALVPLDMRPE
jgi:general stress protein 26